MTRDHAIARARWHALVGELDTTNPSDPASVQRLARLLLRECVALGLDVEVAARELREGTR